MATADVEVELLYLDLDACDRCQATDRNLDVPGRDEHAEALRRTCG